nr:hypothetical protein [Anaerolinea sp.]
MLEDRIEPAQEQDLVSPENLPASRTEQIRAFVNALTGNYRETRTGKPGKGLKTTQSGDDLPGHDLALYASWLAEAHQHFRRMSQEKAVLSQTSEWVLDNYYIIRQAIQQIKEDLPSSYYRQLPRLTTGSIVGIPRIYMLAREVLAYQHLLLDPIELQTILIQYQERFPLTMGELWALPTFLRYGLIEALAHSLISSIHPSKPPILPPTLPLLVEKGGSSPAPETPAEETADIDGVANIILSLRTISQQNWNDFFESVSCLERMLREDPAGIYPQMDFKTRDLYRKEIENLSFASGHDENDLARMIIDLAGPPSSERPAMMHAEGPAGSGMLPGPDGRGGQPDPLKLTTPPTHVGEFLLGKGRAALEQRIGYRPDAKTAAKGWAFQHASAVYLSSVALLSGVLLVMILSAARLPAILGPQPLLPASPLWKAPWQGIILGLLAIAIIIPALTVSTSLINWLITMLIPPRILPKLDFKNEIPDPFQTLVVIPALITSREEIDSLVQQLELHYLRNPEPGLTFAMLTDFKDADSETMPEDEDLVQYATSAIETLNAKYQITQHNDNHIEGSTSDEGQNEGAPRFAFLNRKRLWNPSEGKWMGWERKRGKLHELNRLLRGGENLSFSTLTGSAGDSDALISALQRIRFVITLDADTILPRGAACRLAGTLAHPLNRAVFHGKTGRAASGYTILQPRMEIHPRSANYSWFTRLFAGDAGLDLYTLAVSDAYQDLFGEGIYVGKGIYDVDAFERSVDGFIPENTVLSHDLLEGLMGRAGLVSDITMIEHYPQNY